MAYITPPMPVPLTRANREVLDARRRAAAEKRVREELAKVSTQSRSLMKAPGA